MVQGASLAPEHSFGNSTRSQRRLPRQRKRQQPNDSLFLDSRLWVIVYLFFALVGVQSIVSLRQVHRELLEEQNASGLPTEEEVAAFLVENTSRTNVTHKETQQSKWTDYYVSLKSTFRNWMNRGKSQHYETMQPTEDGGLPLRQLDEQASVLDAVM